MKLMRAFTPELRMISNRRALTQNSTAPYWRAQMMSLMMEMKVLWVQGTCQVWGPMVIPWICILNI